MHCRKKNRGSSTRDTKCRLKKTSNIGKTKRLWTVCYLKTKKLFTEIDIVWATSIKDFKETPAMRIQPNKYCFLYCSITMRWTKLWRREMASWPPIPNLWHTTVHSKLPERPKTCLNLILWREEKTTTTNSKIFIRASKTASAENGKSWRMFCWVRSAKRSFPARAKSRRSSTFHTRDRSTKVCIIRSTTQSISDTLMTIGTSWRNLARSSDALIMFN